MVTRLQQLGDQLPDISLYIHDSLQSQRLTSNQLQIQHPRVDVWFCGSEGLAKALRNGLKQQSISLRFYQEVFEFRFGHPYIGNSLKHVLLKCRSYTADHFKYLHWSRRH